MIREKQTEYWVEEILARQRVVDIVNKEVKQQLTTSKEEEKE